MAPRTPVVSRTAPRASMASSAAPRPVASLSAEQWIGRPSASASMRRQCAERLMAPPEATTTWSAAASGASRSYTSTSRSATLSSAACRMSTAVVSSDSPAMAARRLPRPPGAAALGAVAQRKELLRLDAGGGERLAVPAERVLIEEAGPGGHRDAGGRFAEQCQLQVLADRAPAHHAPHDAWPVAGQPAQ